MYILFTGINQQRMCNCCAGGVHEQPTVHMRPGREWADILQESHWKAQWNIKNLLRFTIDHLCITYSQETTNKESETAMVVEYTNNRLYMGVLGETEQESNWKARWNIKNVIWKSNFLVLNKQNYEQWKILRNY